MCLPSLSLGTPLGPFGVESRTRSLRGWGQGRREPPAPATSVIGLCTLYSQVGLSPDGFSWFLDFSYHVALLPLPTPVVGTGMELTGWHQPLRSMVNESADALRPVPALSTRWPPPALPLLYGVGSAGSPTSSVAARQSWGLCCGGPMLYDGETKAGVPPSHIRI